MNRIKSKENKASQKQLLSEKPIKKNPSRTDGRSATRTGRIVQFATSVTIDFDNTIRQLAKEDGLMMVELLEKALLLYKDQRERERESKIAKQKKKIAN